MLRGQVALLDEPADRAVRILTQVTRSEPDNLQAWVALAQAALSTAGRCSTWPPDALPASIPASSRTAVTAIRARGVERPQRVLEQLVRERVVPVAAPGNPAATHPPLGVGCRRRRLVQPGRDAVDRRARR